MFSRNSVAATGRIVSCDLAPGYQPTSALPCKHIVILDVTPPEGEMFRTETTAKWFPSDHPGVGEVVNVRCNPERRTAAIHLGDDRDPNFDIWGSRRATLGAAQARRQSILDQPPGTPDATSPPQDLAASGAATVELVNDSGADPAAALEKLEKLRAQGVISDAQLAQLRQQLAASGWSSETAGPGTGSGGSAEERLRTLDRLKSEGVLSADEYSTQRQRILDSL